MESYCEFSKLMKYGAKSLMRKIYRAKGAKNEQNDDLPFNEPQKQNHVVILQMQKYCVVLP